MVHFDLIDKPPKLRWRKYRFAKKPAIGPPGTEGEAILEIRARWPRSLWDKKVEFVKLRGRWDETKLPSAEELQKQTRKVDRQLAVLGWFSIVFFAVFFAFVAGKSWKLLAMDPAPTEDILYFVRLAVIIPTLWYITSVVQNSVERQRHGAERALFNAFMERLAALREPEFKPKVTKPREPETKVARLTEEEMKELLKE